MTEETYKYCEHISYGVGSAQLTKYRKDRKDDLFMVTFQSTGFKNKYWFCQLQTFILPCPLFYIVSCLEQTVKQVL